MKNLDERRAQDNSFNPLLNESKQDTANKKTLFLYEQLSFFEREYIAKWIKKNFSQIPMPFRLKKPALEFLLLGEYEDENTLTLIRHALQASHFYPEQDL